MGYTLLHKQLTPVLKDAILEFVNENNANPTGIWRDFHCVHRSWRNLQEFVDAGLISEDDLPVEPDPTDYSNVNLNPTLQCPESRCLDGCNRVYGCQCAYCTGISAEEEQIVLLLSRFTLDQWADLSLDEWATLEV